MTSPDPRPTQRDKARREAGLATQLAAALPALMIFGRMMKQMTLGGATADRGGELLILAGAVVSIGVLLYGGTG